MLFSKKQKSFRTLFIIAIISVCFFLTGCAQFKEMFKVTKIEREEYKPKCKKHWKGKTIFIDFRTTAYWRYSFASGLSNKIKEQLIEDTVNDGCFNVQDYGSGYNRKKYYYRGKVTIARPLIKAHKGVIRNISARFKLKIYNRHNNIVASKIRDVKYKAPAVTVNVNNSQEELLENYCYNVSVQIRKAMYQSFK